LIFLLKVIRKLRGSTIMGKYSRELNEDLMDFISQQKMFFVATAPSDEGRVNLSPKGYDSFKILDTHTIAYLDYAGSGNETANHIRDNGRITFMWNSFDKQPLILRIYGYGQIIEKESAEYTDWMEKNYPEIDKTLARQVILVKIEAIQTSCGFGVPLMEFAGERETLNQWGQKQLAKDALEDYIDKNKARLDEKFPVER
jgi:hypothetical protein